MPRLFLSNFHFEHELADPRFVPTKKLLEINARNARSWLSMATPGDAIALPDVSLSYDIAADMKRQCPGIEIYVGDQLPRGLDWTVIPWGWTPSMARLRDAFQWASNAPHLEAVRNVNSRLFAFDLEQLSGLQPEGSVTVHSLDDLQALLRQPISHPSGWLIKGEFGMSGRERIRVNELALTDSQLGWLRREFASGRSVVVEPFLDCIEEVSFHYDISPDAIHFLAILSLKSDVRGQFESIHVGSEEERAKRKVDWSQALQYTNHAADQARLLGYTGPLGIDAMKYAGSHGDLKIRPLQDINARYTMGRLAFENWVRTVHK